MSKYADTEVSGFLLRSGYSLKQIIRVATQLRNEKKENHNVADAEYEMGRGQCPIGYDKGEVNEQDSQ